MNINKVVISGRLVKDPEIKTIGEVDLCNFRIASNRIVGKKKVEKAIFIDIDAWGGQAKVCEKFLKKGSRVIVDGILCQDTWEDKEGKKNSKVYIESDNVVFLDLNGETTEEETPAKGKPVAPAAAQSAPVKQNPPKAAPAGKKIDEDEELPF